MKKITAFTPGAWVALGFMLLGLVPEASAMITPLPPSLAHDILSETVPTAFSAFDLDVADFALEWEGQAPEGVTLRLEPGSLQWVRVMDVLTLPRARLEVVAEGASGGRVSNAGFSQALAPSGPSRVGAELPVALISGDRNPIEVAVIRGGKESRGRALLRFRPRPELGDSRVFFDPSCSRFGMWAEGTAQSAPARGWGYVGCRFAELEGEEHMASALEAFVFWDNVGQEIRVGGAATPSSSVSVWPLRLRSEPGSVTLQAGAAGGRADQMTIRYGMPKIYHRGFLGLGLGPYTDHFEGNGEELNTIAPVLTLYSSYFITETLRVVGFGAITMDPHLTSDLGVYMHTEYMRVIDRRIVASLLLGVHALGFRSQGAYYFVPGLPQGVEISFIDAFKKGHNFTTGFFLYPPIEGKKYYNVWMRWGSGKLFGEINYISWGERVNEQDVRAQSVGISLGFPVARFF